MSKEKEPKGGNPAEKVGNDVVRMLMLMALLMLLVHFLQPEGRVTESSSTSQSHESPSSK